MKKEKDLPKRTAQELVALHRQEPKIHDIVVEGLSDKGLLEWFVSENGKENTTVYEISSFEVDHQEVQKRQLENNNRGRVISLAYMLHDQEPEIRVTLVADRDFDTILDVRRNCPLLLETDYCSLELYAFDPRVLRKFLSLNVGKPFPKSASAVIAEISAPLEELFLVRLANFQLQWNLQSVSWEKSCKLTNAGMSLSLNDYLTRYLNKNRRASQRKQILAMIQRWRKKMGAEPRHQINGHDMTQMLSWYIAEHRGFSRLDDAVLTRSLLSCIELETWGGYPMFKALLQRIQ